MFVKGTTIHTSEPLQKHDPALPEPCRETHLVLSSNIHSCWRGRFYKGKAQNHVQHRHRSKILTDMSWTLTHPLSTKWVEVSSTVSLEPLKHDLWEVNLIQLAQVQQWQQQLHPLPLQTSKHQNHLFILLQVHGDLFVPTPVWKKIRPSAWKAQTTNQKNSQTNIKNNTPPNLFFYFLKTFNYKQTPVSLLCFWEAMSLFQSVFPSICIVKMFPLDIHREIRRAASAFPWECLNLWNKCFHWPC